VQVKEPLTQYLAATISPQAEIFCKLERLSEDIKLIQKSVERFEIPQPSTSTPSTVKSPVTHPENQGTLETSFTVGNTGVEDIKE
jgi:hypothetical protein